MCGYDGRKFAKFGHDPTPKQALTIACDFAGPGMYNLKKCRVIVAGLPKTSDGELGNCGLNDQLRSQLDLQFIHKASIIYRHSSDRGGVACELGIAAVCFSSPEDAAAAIAHKDLQICTFSGVKTHVTAPYECWAR